MGDDDDGAGEEEAEGLTTRPREEALGGIQAPSHNLGFFLVLLHWFVRALALCWC